MELKEMNVEQLEARKAEIAAEIDKPEADLDALESEARAIKEELERREAEEAKKVEIRKAVADGTAKNVEIVESRKEEKKVMPFEEIRNSREYGVAFAKYLREGMKDDTECRALLSTNGTNESLSLTGYVPVPTFLENEIKTAWEEHQLLNLVKRSNFRGNVKVGFELSATGANVHLEGDSAPDEEVITIGTVEIKAENIKKWITVSDETLEGTTVDTIGYLYREIAHKITEKAEEVLVGKIVAAPATATSTAVGVPEMGEATIAKDTIVKAVALLSGQARNLHIVMNRATYPAFIALALGANYAVDVFDGLKDRIIFSDKVTAYSAASGDTPYLIIGDFGYGFQANFPNGNDMNLLVDNLSLAEKDLVKLVGRMYVGMAVVADKAFVKVSKNP